MSDSTLHSSESSPPESADSICIRFLPDSIKRLLASASAGIDGIYEAYNPPGDMHFWKNNGLYLGTYVTRQAHKLGYVYAGTQAVDGNTAPTLIFLCTSIIESILFGVYFAKMGTLPLAKEIIETEGLKSLPTKITKGWIVGNLAHYFYAYRLREAFIQAHPKLSQVLMQTALLVQNSLGRIAL